MYDVIIIMIMIYAPSTSRCRSWTKMWSPRRHCTPATRNPSQGLFSFRKKSKSLNQRNRHHVCPRLLFETHWVKDLKPHRLVGGHDVAWLESLQKILNISRPRLQKIRQPLKSPRRSERFWGDGSTGRQRQCTLRSKPDEPLPHWSNRMTYR